MAESVDETAAVEAVETAVALDLAPTQAEELAWSSEQQELGDLPPVPPMPLPVEPAPWRAVCRNALAVFSACVAVAGAVTLVDRQWFAELTEVVVVPTGPTAAPSSVIAAPAETAAQPEAWTLPPVPPAEHLVPPVPSGPSADAKYLAQVQQAGVTITDVQWAISSGHLVCKDMARGSNSESEAASVMRDIPGMPHFQALMIVFAAISSYCPEYLGR